MANNIELRSENVRKIVEHRLPFIIRVGITIVTFMIVLLFIVAFFIPLPDTSGGKHPENSRKTFYERMFE